MNRKLRIAILASLLGVALAACGGGSDSGSGSTPPGASAPPANPTPPTGSPPPPTPPSVPGEAPNSAPVIAGTPATVLLAGAAYNFSPSASDADGDNLTFSITGKPAWASFSVATGRLTGTAQVGNFPDIVISVTDGVATRSLPAFSITVTAPVTTASLSWVAPEQFTDGSALTPDQLAGYRVYHGSSPSSLKPYHDIEGWQITSYVARDLAPGQHCFAVTAVAASNVESALSGAGCKKI